MHNAGDCTAFCHAHMGDAGAELIVCREDGIYGIWPWACSHDEADGSRREIHIAGGFQQGRFQNSARDSADAHLPEKRMGKTEDIAAHAGRAIF